MCRRCAWDSNPGLHEERRRRINWAMAATPYTYTSPAFESKDLNVTVKIEQLIWYNRPATSKSTIDQIVQNVQHNDQ